MSDASPILVWIRRDLRLTDHAALSSAAASGRPVIPVFLNDEAVQALGAAPRWRLGLGVEAFANTLAGIGSGLVLRRGDALECLGRLVDETGAGAVYWQRSYDPVQQARDSEIKAALRGRGLEARSFPGHLLFEPWTVETKTGGFYRVYTPYWNAVRGRDPGAPLGAVTALAAPGTWPGGDALSDWRLGAAMDRGAEVTRAHVRPGEAAAQDRLHAFTAGAVGAYARMRDIPAVSGTSRLSEHLTHGEISPRQAWAAGMAAMERGAAGAETFLKELAWREFAYHLLHYTPHIAQANWRPEWDAFPWNTDPDRPEVRAWLRGRTGIQFVDAAMRELYVTGYMHNRARMIVASYLTKHLLTHWKIGLDWFADHLVDWDPAANAMGWQWSAGSGPDATPYFRVFNPVSQLDKFDPERAYVRRWIAEGRAKPAPEALSYFDAIPRSWGLSPGDPYPAPVVGAEDGRKRALSAYENRGF